MALSLAPNVINQILQNTLTNGQLLIGQTGTTANITKIIKGTNVTIGAGINTITVTVDGAIQTSFVTSGTSAAIPGVANFIRITMWGGGGGGGGGGTAGNIGG